MTYLDASPARAFASGLPVDNQVLELGVFDALPDALLVVKSECVVWANEAGLRLLRGPEDAGCEVVGRAFEEFLAPGERQRLAMLEQQRAGDVPATCRIRFVRMSDGASITADLRFGHVGELLIISARDVTEATRAEALMGTLAQTFARSLAFLDANALLDATEPTFEALRWKVSFIEIVSGGSITRRVLAAPLGDPVGDYERSIVGQHIPFEKTPILTDVVKTGSPMFLDNVPTSLSGPIRRGWCPVLVNGKLTHVLAVTGRDLTEHDFVAIQLFAAQIGAAMNLSALRAALVQKERLAAVGEMAAVMAHEVRNPLGIIFNALAGLRRAAYGSELLDIIQEESERLRRLITDLLDFSRPSAVQPENVPVAPLLRDAANAARIDPTSGGATKVIEVDVPDDLPPVETDPLLLRRALVNLLVNALQNVSEGGRVALSATVVGGGELYVRVENDAAPMPPHVAARVFEPFFTTRAAGTGLGLAVVRRILDDLGGSVDLEEPRSSGTSFSLRLPLRATGIKGIEFSRSNG